MSGQELIMLKTIDSLGDLAGKKVLVRSDLNVPLDGTTITDDGRVRASVPTIQKLLDAGASVIVTAHLGRPAGAPEAKYSLAPAAARLSELLGKPVTLADDLVGESAAATVAALQPGDVAMLENVRFDARETSKVDAEREALAAELAAFADAFVSDGFGVVHRKQASVYDVATLLPAAAGLLVQKEVEALAHLLEGNRADLAPFAAILGGAKVSDKIGVIESLSKRVDHLFVGGAMAYTFLAAQGQPVGSSKIEADKLEPVGTFFRFD
jgi:phosphoglycerate kinase